MYREYYRDLADLDAEDNFWNRLHRIIGDVDEMAEDEEVAAGCQEFHAGIMKETKRLAKALRLQDEKSEEIYEAKEKRTIKLLEDVHGIHLNEKIAINYAGDSGELRVQRVSFHRNAQGPRKHTFLISGPRFKKDGKIGKRQAYSIMTAYEARDGGVSSLQSRQPRIEPGEFFRDLEWSDIFGLWCSRMEAHGVRPSEILVRLPIYHEPMFIEVAENACWWRTDDLIDYHTRLQAAAISGDVSIVRGRGASFRVGEKDTALFMGEFADNLSCMCAVLMVASLYSCLDFRQRAYRDEENWPREACVRGLSKMAEDELLRNDFRIRWHHASTSVMPTSCGSPKFELRSARDLIDFLASEHAECLKKYRPVQVYVDPGIPEEIKTAAESLVAERRESRERWKSQWEEDQRKRKKEEEEMDAKHPRWREWGRLGKSEMLLLVWTKPTEELAREFGVSGVAIGKRCKSMGLRKPPRGFWAKVAAGKIPHPNGKPPPK